MNLSITSGGQAPPVSSLGWFTRSALRHRHGAASLRVDVKITGQLFGPWRRPDRLGSLLFTVLGLEGIDFRR